MTASSPDHLWINDLQDSIWNLPLEIERIVMKAFLSCTFGRVCSDIPGACIVLQGILVVVLSSALGYLFVTQELLR
jgi:hypothetical protein